jgi:flavodoxin
MNAVVVYDSLFGNTERIAQAIADTLRAFGQVQAVRVEPAQPVELQGLDMLIMGCPTQGFKATPAMQSFLEKVLSASLSGLAVACFDTRVRGPFGSAARVMARKLQMMGVSLLLPPESFFVKGMQGPLRSGEVERAARWALGIHQQYEAQEAHLAAQKP